MIIFETFQGLENFYIKFQDFPYFSRICMNPDHHQGQAHVGALPLPRFVVIVHDPELVSMPCADRC